MNLIWINSAKYLGDYRLSLSFSNGQLDGWTVSWQDGRLDIAPEYLYEIGTPA